MTRDELEALIEALNEPARTLFLWLHQRGGRTIQGMSRAVGIEASMLSRTIKGIYPGNVDTILARIESAKMRDDRVLANKFIETEVSDVINAVADRCRDYGQMAMIYGASGRGKTFCVQEWMRRQKDTIFNPIYVDCPVDTSLRGLLREIGNQLGVRNVQSTRILRELIEDKINSKTIIIVDECVRLLKLKDPTIAIEWLRRLHDTTGCGVLFIATEIYASNLENGRHSTFFEQLWRRLEDNIQLPQKVTRAEVKKHLEAYTDGTPDAKIIKLGLQIAGTKERLAGLHRLTNNALLLAKLEGRTKINYEDLEAAVMERQGLVQFSE